MWRTAIIGCGNIAGGYDWESSPVVCQTHARACELISDVELVAVCDRDFGKAKAFAERWKARSFHANAHDMLTQAKPDIVSICSPTGTHIDMLELCLEFPGLRAILCEKPVGFDSGRFAMLLPKLEAMGIVLAVNYSRTYAPGIQRWRQRLGELGGCLEATVDYGKGIFSYGSHAIQWFADWLGGIANIEAIGARFGVTDADPNVDATFRAGTVPVQLRGGVKDCFNVEFHCANGALRFSNYAYEVACGSENSSTGLDTVMRDVFSNLIARLEGRPARLVEGREALATLDVCVKLAAQTRNFS